MIAFGFVTVSAGLTLAGEQQRDGDVDALLKSLAEATQAKSSVLRIPTGVYRFGRRSFVLKDLSDMEIDGQGATFVFALRGGGVRLQSCRNLKPKNLFLDMEKPPFIQGTIKAVDSAKKSVDFTPDAGFPSIAEAVFPTKSARYVVMDAEGRRELPLPDAIHAPPVEVEPGLLRANPRNLFGSDKCKFGVGNKIVINMRGAGGGISIHDSTGVTLEDVTVYATGNFAFHEKGRSAGGNVYRRCKLMPRPDSNSIWAGAADAFHSMTQKQGPHLVDCEFSWAFDDLINIHGFISLIVEKRSADSVLLAGPFGLDFDVGDTLQFYNYPGAVPSGEAKVLSVTPVDTPTVKEVERMACEYFAPLTSVHHPVRSFHGKPVLVKFDRAIDNKPFDLAVASSYSCRGAVIENCHLHHGHVRGVLIKSPDAIVRNCVIEHVHRYGIVLFAEQYWLEGPFPHNIKILNNTLVNCGFSSLAESASIATFSAFGAPRDRIASAYNIRDIEISGNTIKDAPGVAVKLVNADGVVLENNKIINPLTGIKRAEKLDFSQSVAVEHRDDVIRNPYFGVVTISTRNVRGTGNRAEKIPDAWRGMIGIGPWSEEITVEE